MKIREKRFLPLTLKKIVLFFFLTLFLSACHSSSKDFAPRNIKDYVIGVTTTKAIKEDIPLLNKTGYYFFDTHGNYTLYYDQKVYEKGEYAYQKVNATSASLILSYSDRTGLNSYISIFEFTSTEGGTWKGSYDNDSLDTEGGTFKILRHGYN